MPGVLAAVVADGRLELEQRPDPVPGDGEVLVRVRAAGINGADLAQRAGRYPPPPGAPPDIPGLECAGEVVAAGPRVRDFREGDRVVALLGGGGHAELVTVHERHALPAPAAFSDRRQAGSWRCSRPRTTRCSLRRGSQPVSACRQRRRRRVGVAGVQLGVAAGAQVTALARHSEGGSRPRRRTTSTVNTT
jgi:D-arabinose 1-dehydrogenase-like Zn-dependent alcohol dehydrogenase